MPRKFNELILEWQRILPVPDEQSAIWTKQGFVDILPGETVFFGMESPNKIGVIIDNFSFAPTDPISMWFGRPVVTIGNDDYKPSSGIFRPGDSEGALQIETPSMIRVPPGTLFAFKVQNTSPAFVLTWLIDARIFTERIPN